MDSVCPSQEKAHYNAKKAHRNAKRKQDECEENQNPSVKKKLFSRPLPDASGFSLEENLKSEVTGLDLFRYTAEELFNMVPSQKDYWKHY